MKKMITIILFLMLTLLFIGCGKADKEPFTQCIAFDSSFHSPENGGGAWEANEEYTWSWWLARSEGGKWKLMTWGY